MHRRTIFEDQQTDITTVVHHSNVVVCVCASVECARLLSSVPRISAQCHRACVSDIESIKPMKSCEIIYCRNRQMADYEQFPSLYSSSSLNTNGQYVVSNNMQNNRTSDSPPAKIPNNCKYPVVHDNGHRRYGPPAEWVGDPPSRGCEVFIGKIPRDCLEDELIPIFETIGPIYEFRLMVDFNGVNRGYGFCVYQKKDDSNRAVEKLNNYEIRPGKTIGVCFSVDNCRLFVGGIPKTKTKEEIFAEMQRVTSGVVNVIAYPSIANKNKNRGFAFVEYESHKSAAVARRKLIPGRIPLWGQQIAVDWAEPEREVHETIMSTVKILYARNLMLTTTEETLREKFLAASGGPYNCIERVKKMKDYAFIHFTERTYAENAKHILNNTEVDGSIVEVTWAKPADKATTKQSKIQPNLNELSIADLQAATTQIYYDPNTGLSYIGPAMGSWSNSLNILGDAGIRNKPARRNAAGSRNSTTFKEKKQSIEYLEELATTYNWGSPQYSTSASDLDINGVKTSLFSAQVFLPNLNVKQVTQVLHATPDEAKASAADLFVKSVTQPPSPFNGLEMRQQMAALFNLPNIINPQSGSINPTQQNSMELNSAAAIAAAGASLYYLQPGLANSALFHPNSLLSSPQSNQLNLAAFNNLYSTPNTNMSSVITTTNREVNAINNLFTTNHGLGILPSPSSIPLLSMNLELNNNEMMDNSALRNAFIANQQQNFLYNGSQQSLSEQNNLLMGQQVPSQ